MNDDRKTRRAAIAEAICALRRGDEDAALALFAQLAGSSGRALRDSVLDLAEADTEMLRTMTGHGAEEDLLDVLVDEESIGAAEVDAVDPEHRTATRVLLALLAGHREDAELQLDLAETSPDPTSTGQVFVHALSRTMKLLDACVSGERPVPTWLRPVLTR